MERITPGNTLKDKTDFEYRIKIGADMVNRLPVSIDDNHNFPVYAEQMKKAFDRVRAENRAGNEFLSSLTIAERLYKELQEQNRLKLLLHGDLHHENILRTSLGEWKVIDPQGRIGEKILEAGRFFQNEWDMHSKTEVSVDMVTFISTFAEVLGEDEKTVAVSCYLDCTLSACWSLEDGSGLEKIEVALSKIRWLGRYL